MTLRDYDDLDLVLALEDRRYPLASVLNDDELLAEVAKRKLDRDDTAQVIYEALKLGNDEHALSLTRAYVCERTGRIL